MLLNVIAYLGKNWGKVYFFTAVAAVVFSLGYVSGAYKKFPYSVITGAVETFKYYKTQLKNEYPGLNRVRHEGVGVVVNKAELTEPGVTLLGTPWQEGGDWLHSMRLVDMNGELIHKWTIEPEKVWKESPHDDLYRGKKSNKLATHIHGSVLLPGGDVVFNLSHYGMIRLDACSNIVWKVPLRAHHSVDMDENGNFWAPGEIWHDKPVEKFPGFGSPFVEDTILQVSADGEVLRHISILDAIFRSGYEGLLFSSQYHKYERDVTHNNDVEVLDTRLAPQFEGLKAGDIMVSLRNISTVLIIDGETEKVKWALQHPLVRQHDPDFVEGGFISIFDNRANPRWGDAPGFGGSRIIRVRPFSDDVEVVYASSEANKFYTRGGGKHQYLKNGNILMVEPYGGRAFEISGEGELVWSWHSEHWAGDDSRVPEVHDADRYPTEYGDFPKDCS